MRARLRIAAAVLWVALCTLTAAAAVERGGVFAPLEPQCVERPEALFGRLRPFLPEHGIVGYAGPRQVGVCDYFYVAQYSLAPVYVVAVDEVETRVSLRDRTQHVLPITPPLVLLYGDQGRRWSLHHPRSRIVARASPELVLAAEDP